jgi:hypothetical protein
MRLFLVAAVSVLDRSCEAEKRHVSKVYVARRLAKHEITGNVS